MNPENLAKKSNDSSARSTQSGAKKLEPFKSAPYPCGCFSCGKLNSRAKSEACGCDRRTDDGYPRATQRPCGKRDDKKPVETCNDEQKKTCAGPCESPKAPSSSSGEGEKDFRQKLDKAYGQVYNILDEKPTQFPRVASGEQKGEGEEGIFSKAMSLIPKCGPSCLVVGAKF